VIVCDFFAWEGRGEVRVQRFAIIFLWEAKIIASILENLKKSYEASFAYCKKQHGNVPYNGNNQLLGNKIFCVIKLCYVLQKSVSRDTLSQTRERAPRFSK
jgi:hypothetical protein